MIKEHKFETYSFLLIFLLVIILNIFLLLPLFNAIIFGGIMAGTFYPLFNYCHIKKNLSRKVASLITTLTIILFILLPLIYLSIQISKEAITLYGVIKDGFTNQSVQNFIFGEGPTAIVIQNVLDTLNIEITKDEIVVRILERVKDYSGVVLQIINSMIGDTLSTIFQFLIMIITTFGFFIKGDKLKETLFEVSPLPSSQEQKVLDKFNQMNYVTMVGNGLGGLIQGGFAGLVFWFVGLPSVFLWTTVMIILAFIPLIGISIVTIPASIYLFITGSKVLGITLFSATTLVSLIVENWFKPRFIGKKISVDGILIFLYIIAGMSIFGMAGIFYGPLICIITVTILDIYVKSYLPKLKG